VTFNFQIWKTTQNGTIYHSTLEGTKTNAAQVTRLCSLVYLGPQNTVI